nr:hypothetical protein [uncultured Cohaesibacter sp.]
MTPEVRENQTRFEQKWRDELISCIDSLSGNEVYMRSYSRLVSFQAWKVELFQDLLSKSVLQFALEGQNDLLVSYLLARGGQWRSALQSLRAAIENYLNCLYFMDHPVELKLWELGQRRNQFSELIDYFGKHPKHTGLAQSKFGLDIIKKEYATLSKAVHASAVSFRMSVDDEPRFFGNKVEDLQKWETRSKSVCRGLNLLILSLFRENLIATRKKNLREAISYSLKPSDKDWIKETFSVTLRF